MRKLVGIVFLLWALSSGAAMLHFHECCCGHHEEQGREDEAPCSICLAVQHVPVIGLARPETVEARQDVCAWISPWIAMVPEEVFFDRPLARGPPTLS